MGEGELQRGGLQRHAVRRAHRLDAAHLVLHLVRRDAVAVARRGAGAGGQDARGVGRADDHRDVVVDAAFQPGLQPLLVEQGVGHGDDAEIERHQRRDADEAVGGVEAHADGLDLAIALELLERLDAALGHVLHALRVMLAMGAGFGVVDQQGVNGVEAEAQ